MRTGPLPPDGAFGRGLMEIDFDAHEFASTGNWQEPGENILYGCKVLAESLEFIRLKGGHRRLRAGETGSH